MEESTSLSGDGSPEEMLGFDETLKFLGTSKTTLYRLLEQGDLKGVRVGRQWRFRRAELTAYLERGSVSSAPASEVDAEVAFFEKELEQVGYPLPEEISGIEDSGGRRTLVLALRILAFAISTGASDLHLEPEKNRVLLRLRIGGVLQIVREMPPSLAEPLVVTVKQLSDMNVVERRLPQDGRFPWRYHGKEYDLRVSCLPGLRGEGVVMRILDRSTVLLGLDKLGITPQDQIRLDEWLHRQNGMIVVTGPTGSGKSTLLYSCLIALNRPEVKILSIEDPIEYEIPGVRQVAVNRKAGLTFAAGLRTFLRQDPDIMMAAQMRDLESLEIAIEAALTGHLVLTALHTEDAVSALIRLRDIGIERFLIADTVRGVVAQRLVRTLCNHCKTAEEKTESATRDAVRQLAATGGFALPDNVTFYRATGCPQCRNTGFQGRTGLFELLTVTPEITTAFKQVAPTDEIVRLAVAQGMRTLLADGIAKAARGLTTVDEVLRVCGVTL